MRLTDINLTDINRKQIGRWLEFEQHQPLSGRFRCIRQSNNVDGRSSENAEP